MKSGQLVGHRIVTKITARMSIREAIGFAKMTAGLDASVHRVALLVMESLAFRPVSAPRSTDTVEDTAGLMGHTETMDTDAKLPKRLDLVLIFWALALHG